MSSLNAVAVALLAALGGVFLIGAMILAAFVFLSYSGGGRIRLGLGAAGSYDDEQQQLLDERQYLGALDQNARAAYYRARAFVDTHPPDEHFTEISLAQHLAIQEKGVAAWEFVPEPETAACFVQARTEIAFYDGDGECSVQTNLPVPRTNDVYYWEAKVFEKPEAVTVAVGVASKPYPLFRLPGWHKHSVAYLSDGVYRHNQPFTSQPVGPLLFEGDVVGVGYKPRSGTIFFTRNGKKLQDVTQNMKMNLFPTIGATGPCSVHVNFGQMGFVFIEANVKKWGLAPMVGTLAPPPAYGLFDSSILLESGTGPSELQRYLPPSPGPVHRSADISLAYISTSPPAYSSPPNNQQYDPNNQQHDYERRTST
ncbi:Protein ssh4 [Neolecta irregularis DAH-3]|uniref:Protein ssh4 n=1 Tax=Neolecta irregularis (strain DAH-3) TaxID=1198029 RepID=A0A1U7LWG1_NEOID|nr:Protein ssh4 [Neolecta irregularis DAH-3]|eukprot:OLL27016.1 Protein ssh4 [Neolecta irregularis DAH-3]